jgi:hypothetical protein
MAAERLSMRTIKEVLRLKWEKKLPNKQIAKSCNIARSTIREYLERAQCAGLTWPLPSDLDDGRLEALLFSLPPTALLEKRGLPAMEYLRQELTRKGVTLRLLWLEYRQANPDGYQYSQFCLRYQQWREKLDVCLRQIYRAGEKLFVDYAGQTIPGIGPVTALCLLQLEETYPNANRQELTALVGLDPRERKSGTSLHPPKQISKNGHAMVRRLLYLAALSAARGESHFLAAFYRRLVLRGKHKKQALIAVARKLLLVAHAVYRNEEPFRAMVYEGSGEGTGIDRKHSI